MKRGILAALTVPLFAMAAIPVFAQTLPPGGTFIDDNGSVHEGDIEAIAAAGVTRGCNPPTNDQFCPDDSVTRGEMAAFIVRARSLPATGDDFFDDDEGSAFEDDINRMAAAGITNGCDEAAGLYCPTGLVSRGEMAAFLVRSFGYVAGLGSDLFGDDDTSVFEDDIDRLGTADITRGCNPPTNDAFCPQDPVSRGEMASFLARALGLDPIPVPTSSTSTTDGGSTSTSDGGSTSTTDGGSTSTTNGGSTSTTNGGSTSTTNGGSTTSSTSN